MSKYIFNNSLYGYEELALESEKWEEVGGNLLIVVVDKAVDKNLSRLYVRISDALKRRSKIILIGVDDSNVSFKPLASMLVNFNNYDVYQVSSVDDISPDYLIKLESREPSITEVQTYIGGEIVAYNDISNILFAIESLVDDGDVEGIKEFTENNIGSLENLVTTLNNMRKSCEQFNSNELTDKLKSVLAECSELESSIEKRDNSLLEIRKELEIFKNSTEQMKKLNDKLQSNLDTLKEQEANGGAIIKSYREINTARIACKTKLVIYFKEVTYVRYTNSLVEHLTHILSELNKKKVKLVIYDNQTSMCNMYGNIPSVSGKEYAIKKDQLLKMQRMVVTEPSPVIIQDILESEEAFDVVIVYDRMKNSTDIVSGNNVTKMFVVNSTKDYDACKGNLKIKDTSNIISCAESNILDSAGKKSFMYIPSIDNYRTSTPTAKVSRYTRLEIAESKQNIINEIWNKSRVATLLN